MLKIFRSFNDISFSSLLEVYRDGLIADGCCTDNSSVSAKSKFEAEQDFYYYLKDYFFADSDAFYAVWEVHERYTAALRMEPYRDGLLLEGLETAPDIRNQGYATILLRQCLGYLSDRMTTVVYSHVDKKNVASVRVHRKCGFILESDFAVYIDGSYSSSAYTFCVNVNKK